jgi:hypothetical protein
MTTLAETVRATNVWVANGKLGVDLADGRSITYPLSFFPRLAHATPADLANWELYGDGTSIHWPQIDEDVHVPGLFCHQTGAMPNDKSRGFSAILLAARKESRLSQQELADKIDYSQSLVSMAENGRIPMTRAYVARVIEACGLPEGWEP